MLNLSTLDKILYLLKLRGMPDSELARKIGVGRSTISDWKTGKTKSYRRHIQGIAKALDVSAEYLLELEDSSTETEKEKNINDKHIKSKGAEEAELLRIFREISVKDRVMLMSYAYKLESKKNNNIINLPELNLKAAKDDEVE